MSHLARFGCTPESLGTQWREGKNSMFDMLMACAILATMTAFITVAFFRSRLMRLVGGNENKLLALLALDIAATTALLFGIAVLFAG